MSMGRALRQIQGTGLKPGIIFSAPAVPLDVAMIAKALASAGQLERLVTYWCFTAQEWQWARRLPLPESCFRRPLAPVPLHNLKRLASADLRRTLGRWLDSNRFETIDQSFQIVDRAAAALLTPETAAVIGREDSCLACFQRGKELNIPRIYQLPTAHYKTVERLLKRELHLIPEAFAAEEIDADFAPARIHRKAMEIDLATHHLCSSSFVADSLRKEGIKAEQISMLPLGVERSFAQATFGRRDPVVLYVGTVSARKGVHRLIRVWRQLGAHRTHRLRLIGDLRLPRRFVAEYRHCFEHIPRLPRSSLVNEYGKAQIFIFNALADGFGYVIAEAMACGTPVLASRNSGAPDLVGDGQEGWLFDYGDDKALGAAIDRALSSPQQLLQMGKSARRRAIQWDSDQCAFVFLKWVGELVERTAPRESWEC